MSKERLHSLSSFPGCTTEINARHDKSIEVLRKELVAAWSPDPDRIENKSTLIREITTCVNRIVERWKDLENGRDADIKSARFMTSLPDRTHSYGQFALFQKSKFSDFALDVKS